MQTVKRKFFKEEIRKAFIRYALAPIIIFSFIFYNLLFLYSMRMIKNHNIKYNQGIASVIDKEFSDYKNEAEELSNWLELRKIFYTYYDETEIYEKFYNIVNRHSIRSVFYVFNAKGEVLITNSKVIPQYSKSEDLFLYGAFKRMKDNPNEAVMVLNRAQLDVNTRTVYSIGKAITVEGGSIRGFVVFDILENQLNNIIQSNTSHNAVITDRYNNNIVTSNNALLDSIGKLKPLSSEKNIYVYSKPIIKDNIFIHTVTSLSFIKNIYFIGEIFLIILFSILIVTLSYITKRIATSKTKAIDELIFAIKSVQEGNLDTIVNIKSNDEFELIGEAYNEMLVKINELIEKNKEEVERSTLAEIKELEAQFNPHFLFNTLEMLKYMVRIDKDNSVKVIVALANLLRYSINNTVHRVKLIEDIKYIEDYLTIQKFRFDTNFDYRIELVETAKECIVPKLIIQPIIENSIKYGFESKHYLKVEISCKLEADNLVIEISDNGEGMTQDRLEEITALIEGSENCTNHIGLYNVQKRIKLMYGAEYGIKLCSKLKEGTKVYIKLPKIINS